MVTVGMNYDVIEGKEAAFEAMFAKVLELMQTLPGHEHTQLYRAVNDPRAYLIVSQWTEQRNFDAFVQSEQFAKVADWGKSQILSKRPRHDIYGSRLPTPPVGRQACPVAH